MLLLISLLVIVHELGHFLVARALKIRVDRFGFGLPFGPTLWEKKIGDVTYCIHAFLLGGYVAFPDDDPDSDIPEDDPGRLKNRKVWERALVISAGVVCNAILAYIIVLGVVIFTLKIPTNQHLIYVKGLSKEITIATKAGLKPKDQIIAVNNIKLNNFYQFKKVLEANKANDGYITEADTDRQLKRILENNPQLLKEYNLNVNNLSDEFLEKLKGQVIPKFDVLLIPKATYKEALIPDLSDPFSSPNVLPEKDKLNQQEILIKKAILHNKFAGDGNITLGELAKATADGPRLITITVKRKNKLLNINISPNSKGIIGISNDIKPVYVDVVSPQVAIIGSWDFLSDNTYLMVLGLYKIFTGQVDLRDLHGIVKITQVGGEIIKEQGLADGWLLTALISIDLAIVNLLPIPALDGGHLLFLLIEKLRGRPIEEKYQEAFVKYGFFFLIGLMVLIIFNDIVDIVTKN